jgi:hypothetical protein
MEEAGRLLTDAEKRLVAWTTLGDYTVSTVFLVFDHAIEGDPVLFETMLIHDKKGYGEDLIRYKTWEDALIGHQVEVKRLMVTYGIEPTDKEIPIMPSESKIRKIRIE